MTDLIDPALGITLDQAIGINDSGQIVTNGRPGPNDSNHVYLLTRIPKPSALSCGGSANGSIGLTQVAQYAFAGQAGGSITLTLANSGSTNTPQASLLDPSGKAVLRFSASESPQSVTLGSTGTYRILVFGGATAYSLGLQCNSGMNGEGFVPVPPCRIPDTRVGSGFSDLFGSPSLTAHSTRTFPIPSGSCNIPSRAQAYSLNVTVVPPAPLGYLSIWPTGQSQPVVSTLNSFDGRVVAMPPLCLPGRMGLWMYMPATTPT